MRAIHRQVGRSVLRSNTASTVATVMFLPALTGEFCRRLARSALRAKGTAQSRCTFAGSPATPTGRPSAVPSRYPCAAVRSTAFRRACAALEHQLFYRSGPRNGNIALPDFTDECRSIAGSGCKGRRLRRQHAAGRSAGTGCGKHDDKCSDRDPRNDRLHIKLSKLTSACCASVRSNVEMGSKVLL